MYLQFAVIWKHCLKSSDENSPNDTCHQCTVEMGLPGNLRSVFSQSTPYNPHQYILNEVEAVLKGLIDLNGSQLIAPSDLESLVYTVSKSATDVTSTDKWLTNNWNYSIIDEYMKLIQIASKENGMDIITVPWESFETRNANEISKLLQKSHSSPLSSDMIIVPCNERSSQHWTLLVAQPKENTVLVLGSKPGDFVKPPTQKAIGKMAAVLKGCTQMLT